MTPEQLVEIPGIGEKMVEKIHQSVKAHFEALEAAESGAAAELIGEVVVESSGEPVIEPAGEGAGSVEAVPETENSTEATVSDEETGDAETAGETETAGEATGETAREASSGVEGTGTDSPDAGETAPEDENK